MDSLGGETAVKLKDDFLLFKHKSNRLSSAIFNIEIHEGQFLQNAKIPKRHPKKVFIGVLWSYGITHSLTEGNREGTARDRETTP